MPIKTESLSDFGIRNISGYATEVNLDRAIPELYDGLKPVLRRVAWSMNSFKGGEAVKSAKVVGHCFAAGTKVIKRHGSEVIEVPIEQLKIGQMVFSDAHDVDDHGFRMITNTFIINKQKLLRVICKDGVQVDCTTDQVFYRRGIGEQVRACDLKCGDELLAFSHEKHSYFYAVVVSVEPLEGLHTVYDIEVEEAHTFYANGLLVHNCIGSYHPHGDAAAYGAMQTMVHHNVPLLEGVGNWGGLLDPAAAQRYCFVGSTRINTEKGLLKLSTLAKRSGIKNSDNVKYSILVDTKSEPSHTSHFVNSGIQSIVEVTTDRGYRTTCTPNEPFYVITRDGFSWVRADELKKGDWLCLKRGTNLTVKGSHKLPIEYAKFLGYMVGDGFMNVHQNYLGFNQVDTDVFDDFLSCANVFLKDYVSSFSVSDKQPRGYGKKPYKEWNCYSVKARQHCKKYGLYEGDSYDRKVPECVFKGSTEFMQAFLRTLFECDGSVVHQKGSQSSTVSLSSVSKQLLDDVGLILRSQFGIFPSFSKNSHTNEYKLYITDVENVHRFKEYIGFISARKNDSLWVNEEALNGGSIGGGINDCIPFSKELGFSRNKTTRRASFRRKVRCDSLVSKAAQLIYERDYYFCKVESVVDAGEAQVWDLTVPANHSFVADGFIVHNTNVKLSKMGASVFESDYLAVTDMVPNYDDTAKEPVVLPVRLPMLVLNGADGIGVGITCSIPTFTVESVVEVLKQLFSGTKLEPKDYARILKPKQHWGGHLVKSTANKKAWLELMETGKAKVQFESTLVVDEAKKSITISEWPSGLSVDKFVQKVRLFPECQRCYNSKGSTTFTIECKKAYNITQFNTFVEKVQKLTRVATAYKLNVTHRVSETKDGVTRYKTEFLALSVSEFFLRWCRLRLQLEKRCLEYRMNRQQGLIDYSKLLIFACSKLPVIFKSLKVKDSAQYLVDNLGITMTQANQILDLKVRALSKLDQDALKTKLREQEMVLKVLQKTYRKPKPALIAELPTLLDLIKVDKQVKNKRFNQQLTVH